MNRTKKITITGYLVRYADLREPKPRTIHEEVYPLDSAAVDALGLLGLNVADFITSRYERGGYHVTSVERITPKRVAAIGFIDHIFQRQHDTTMKISGICCVKLIRNSNEPNIMCMKILFDIITCVNRISP